MRNLAIFAAIASITGTIAVVGCSSSGGGGFTTSSSTGTGGGHTSSSSGTTSSGTTSSGTTSSGTTSSSSSSSSSSTSGHIDAGPSMVPVCTGIPATPPSAGSCVSFMSDAGVELDAGVDDAGNAHATNCNPITNSGCTGSDTCQPDNSDKFWTCQPVGTMPNIAVCGDCTGAQQYCAAGGLCVGINNGTMGQCWQMCCTDADCGGTAGTCVKDALQNPLPSGVGVCFYP